MPQTIAHREIESSTAYVLGEDMEKFVDSLEAETTANGQSFSVRPPRGSWALNAGETYGVSVWKQLGVAIRSEANRQHADVGVYIPELSNEQVEALVRENRARRAVDVAEVVEGLRTSPFVGLHRTER